MLLGDLNAAERDFRAALRIAPGNAAARANLARLETQTPSSSTVRAEGEGQAAEWEAKARAEAERQAAEKAQAERQEQERLAAAEREAKAQQREQERVAAELAAKAEAERREREQQEAEKQKALVRRAQLGLATLGYDIGQPDGVLGRRTRDALAAYRTHAGLSVDPTLTEEFVAGLEGAADDARRRRLAESRAREKAEAERMAEAESLAATSSPPAGRVAVEEPPTTPTQTPSALVTAAMPPAKAEIAPTSPEPPAVPASPPIIKSQQPDGRRVALVIGNGAYRTQSIPALPNPPNDAADVAAALERIGFEVFKGINLGRLEMEDLSVRFARAVDSADIALAFYAGHGLQVRGRNYLVPIDVMVEDERDLRRLITSDSLVDDASTARRLAVVMLDACRDNPLSRILERGLSRTLPGRGLARPSRVPAQTLIAYATAEGAVAADGTGRNSPFTAAFLRYLAEPGLDVRLLFGKVRDTVVAVTAGGQRPNIYGDLGGEPIYLVPRAPEPQELEPVMAPEERKALQRALGDLRFYRGPEDGVLSYELRAAIRDFQLSLGKPVTGYVTAEQLVELHRLARERRPPEKLPPLSLIQVLRQSESGDAGAQLLRGMLHDTGYEAGALPKDDEEAARWYRRAAEAGNVEAALNLGRMLKAGRGVPRDPAEAARLLRAAANAGNSRAQLELAELLLEGTGVSKDEIEAARLLRLAAAQPDGAEAIARLRVLDARNGGGQAAR
jgi:TPR repeat protein